MEYEALLKEYDATELIIKEKDLHGSNGRIRGNRIAIKKDISLRQKACVLAEELETVSSFV